MHTKVELTDLELRMLNLFLERGGFSGLDAPEEELNAMTNVIRKAEQLMHDLDAYEELGDNLLLWFYEKIYHKPYPTDDASELKILID